MTAFPPRCLTLLFAVCVSTLLWFHQQAAAEFPKNKPEALANAIGTHKAKYTSVIYGNDPSKFSQRMRYVIRRNPKKLRLILAVSGETLTVNCKTRTYSYRRSQKYLRFTYTCVARSSDGMFSGWFGGGTLDLNFKRDGNFTPYGLIRLVNPVSGSDRASMSTVIRPK